MKTEIICVTVPFTIEYDETKPDAYKKIIETTMKELPYKLSGNVGEIIRHPATGFSKFKIS